MSGKLCLVTGANSGLGLVTARELARMGADVLLVCRSREKGAAALEEVRRAAPGGRAELAVADFARLADVRRLAGEVRAAGRPLDVLVNNAGLMLTERRVTAEGFEYTFAVNHLAPFLLTDLLLEPLHAARRGRIVNVASRAHTRARLDLGDLQGERRWHGWRAYGRAKLCNVLFTLELDRRLRERASPVTVNCLHPGVIRTGFGREATGLFGWALRVGQFLLSSPEKGAETQLYLATSPEVEGVSGRYFVDRQPVGTSQQAADPELARRLWEVSARMVGVAV